MGDPVEKDQKTLPETLSTKYIVPSRAATSAVAGLSEGAGREGRESCWDCEADKLKKKKRRIRDNRKIETRHFICLVWTSKQFHFLRFDAIFCGWDRPPPLFPQTLNYGSEYQILRFLLA